MSDSTDLRPLFASYTRGEITAEQLASLETALRDDSDLRRDFIEYLNLDSALGDLAALSETEFAAMEALESEHEVALAGTNGGPSRTFRVVAFLGAIAAALLMAALVWLASPSDDDAPPVAKLVTDVDALLMCDGQPWSDAELRAGKYRLDKGLLHLQFAGGVMVYVEAPARFDAVSGKRLLLHSGRLSASVPPEGVGFTVETPEAEVIDFGTEFSVDVEAGSSEVHVFQGLVRVQPRSSGGGMSQEAVDLRTSQAIKIDEANASPVEIELATHRFIRTFDESRRKYVRTVKQLSPVAYYRMAIRDQGLACVPPEYSGVVLTGDGGRPPHASGVFAGGSLRVMADSTGRGGRVDTPPALRTGQFTLAVFLYLQQPANGGTVATNLGEDDGSFALTLDEEGRIQFTMRNRDGELRSVSSQTPIPLQTWQYVVMTCDGEQLRIYENGQLAATSPCTLMADSTSELLWFGTDAEGLKLWNGRIDELCIFDKALDEVEIADLYRAALDEIAGSK